MTKLPNHPKYAQSSRFVWCCCTTLHVPGCTIKISTIIISTNAINDAPYSQNTSYTNGWRKRKSKEFQIIGEQQNSDHLKHSIAVNCQFNVDVDRQNLFQPWNVQWMWIQVKLMIALKWRHNLCNEIVALWPMGYHTVCNY